MYRTLYLTVRWEWGVRFVSIHFARTDVCFQLCIRYTATPCVRVCYAARRSVFSRPPRYSKHPSFGFSVPTESYARYKASTVLYFTVVGRAPQQSTHRHSSEARPRQAAGEEPIHSEKRAHAQARSWRLTPARASGAVRRRGSSSDRAEGRERRPSERERWKGGGKRRRRGASPSGRCGGGFQGGLSRRDRWRSSVTHRRARRRARRSSSLGRTPSPSRRRRGHRRRTQCARTRPPWSPSAAGGAAATAVGSSSRHLVGTRRRLCPSPPPQC